MVRSGVQGEPVAKQLSVSRHRYLFFLLPADDPHALSVGEIVVPGENRTVRFLLHGLAATPCRAAFVVKMIRIKREADTRPAWIDRPGPAIPFGYGFAMPT